MKSHRQSPRADYSAQRAGPDDRAWRRASEQKGQPITSFARQKRNEFRGEFEPQPLQTVANLLRPAHLLQCKHASESLFAQADEESRRWNKPVAPFQIAGNLYYVGAIEIASYLITTPEGHFLLDGGFVETAPQIERNITELGFKLTDVKFLLNSDAHCDHAGGLAELKKVTGAKFLASEGDAPVLRSGGHGDFRFGDRLAFPPIEPDKIIHDGESIQLGNQVMIAHLTPGHTKGCTTWTTKIRDGNKVYDVVFVGSQSALDYKFVGPESYPGITSDFEKSFALLNHLPCDIFLASHGSLFHFVEKHERLLRGDANAFIDPDGYKIYLPNSEQDFRNKFAEQKAAQK